MCECNWARCHDPLTIFLDQNVPQTCWDIIIKATASLYSPEDQLLPVTTYRQLFYDHRHWMTVGHIHRLAQKLDSLLCPPLIGRGISHAFVWRLSVWLSVAYIGSKSRIERPKKTKIGTDVAHVTRLGHHFQGQKVKVTRPLYSPPCWRVRQLQRWVWERVGREKLLLRCRLLGRARRFSAHGETRGAGAYRGGRPPTACFHCQNKISVTRMQSIMIQVLAIWQPVCGTN